MFCLGFAVQQAMFMFSSFACFELCRRGSSKRYRLGHEKPHNHNVLVSAILKLAQA